MESDHLKDLILETIKVYNRYRSPEATATLVELGKDSIVIDFEGPFCQSCGGRDYFEDFIYELKTINKQPKIELEETERTGPESYRIQYKIINNLPSENEEDSFFKEFLAEQGLTFKEYMASNSCSRDVILFHYRTWLFERKHKN